MMKKTEKRTKKQSVIQLMEMIFQEVNQILLQYFLYH
ncbi:unnamed protein product [Trichobilharzia regenti]|nr:unnamed protein product [Trichobilharzia regenti]